MAEIGSSRAEICGTQRAKQNFLVLDQSAQVVQTNWFFLKKSSCRGDMRSICGNICGKHVIFPELDHIWTISGEPIGKSF